MNTTLSLCLALLFCFSGSAQDKWMHYYVTIAGANLGMDEICGDTLLGNETYDKIYLNTYDFNTYELEYKYLQAFRRIEGNKVYLKYTPESNETLLYDFDVNVGDSINAHYLVTKIDSVFVFNEARKRIFFRSEEFDIDDIWVEGIGSVLHGYLYPLTPLLAPDFGSELVCYYDGTTQQTYQAETEFDCVLDLLSSSCSTTSSEQIENLNNKSVLLPNPSSDHFFIKHSYTGAVAIKILSAEGKLIQKSVLDKGSSLISCPGLISGLYFVELINERQREILKMIIQ